jgi:hypothetical protein
LKSICWLITTGLTGSESERKDYRETCWGLQRWATAALAGP